MSAPKDRWSSRIGVIMAVAGSSVGLGNFLRFPGLAAQYGGGAFMLAIFAFWLLINVFSVNFNGGYTKSSSYVKDLFVELSRVAWLSLALAAAFAALLALLVSRTRLYNRLGESDNRKP